MYRKFFVRICVLLVFTAVGQAQATWQQSGTSQEQLPVTSGTTTTTTTTTSTTRIQPLGNTEVNEVKVVKRSIQAIDYHGGSTKVDFRSTRLMPQASGNAKVDSHTGRTTIDSHFEHMAPARNYGPEFLTYVLWAITPQGRPNNLGEVIPNSDGKGSLKVTTNLQAFGMIVTAEPYYSSTRPSNMVLLENVPRSNTKGTQVPIEAKFETLDRSDYVTTLPTAELPATTAGAKTPLQLLEARNAVALARAAGAEQYAPDAYGRAQEFLTQAETYYQNDNGGKSVDMAARSATQSAEDARLLAIQRRQQAQVAAHEQAAHQQAMQAQQQAVQAQQQAEMARQEAGIQKAQAELQKQQAENAAREAAQQRAAAEQARQEALLNQQQLEQAQQQAQTAEQRAALAEQYKEQTRQQLLTQLNQVLQTRDTARGLIAEMNDVLFDTGSATLKPQAKVELAKIAGIIEAYPDLHLPCFLLGAEANP